MRRNHIIFLLSTIFIALSVFFLIFQIKSDKKPPFYVVVLAEEKPEQINCWKNEKNEYFVFLPSYAELSKVQIKLNTESQVCIDGKALKDGMLCKDFELDIPYNLTYTSLGISYKHSVTFVRSGNIASMYINTESGNMDYIHSKKGNEESGAINLYLPDGTLNYAGDLESINGRGNNTWEDFDKKPYSLKFKNDANLLGMGEAQKWILIANADDTSNLRNKIVFDFAQDVGLEYSPDSQWVDLYLNGEYTGLYLLSERNEIHSERVNISENNSFLVSLEFGERLKTQNLKYFSLNSGQALRVHYLSKNTGDAINALTDTFQSVENAIVAEDGIDSLTGKSWQELIDLDSWAKKYLIEEVFGNYDACLISQFFYCDTSDNLNKIYAGPVWDYDHSMGNKVTWQLRNPNTLYANRLKVKDGYDTPWFYNLYRKEEFYNRMVELYKNEFLPLMESLLNNGMAEYNNKILQASFMNQLRWFSDTDDSTEQSEYIDSYMTERIDFLSSVWLENKSYCSVRADSGVGANYCYYAVALGERLKKLPEFEDTENSVFLGWYYVDTDEPFDINKPIYEDTQIYAKWQDSASNKFDDILKLVPLAVIAMIFIVLFAVEVKRLKRNR